MIKVHPDAFKIVEKLGAELAKSDAPRRVYKPVIFCAYDAKMSDLTYMEAIINNKYGKRKSKTL